ncbi:Na/Pi cotransporter family protein [Thomasclavelia ramosa]|uniref:Na/Pi cotransporter family protein n=1 Tax=Thomasclavelia ramosa TaxID=1547 RepID=UPI0021088D9D|nr:Na/Pi cotransporter family protein [Thomasclavelia ramosa]MCQ5113358.1 Na/Pi cotransporter family protein [Thomasclavelia ramosa]
MTLADIDWPMILAGLGLFLFGIEYMGDGLKGYSGDKMKDIIDKYTSSPFKGIVIGAFVTCLIQSSSGTTALAIGLIRSGLMTLEQSIGIIMGANIGTVITSVFVGLKVSQYAVYFIILGAAFLMFSKNKKTKYMGQIIFGFGCLFYGLELMGDNLANISKVPEFTQVANYLSQNPWLGLLGGTLLTTAVQSSAAVIAIAQQMYGAGAIGLSIALPFLFGSNIGTTITAVLASFGGTVPAKRAAFFHVLFNVVGSLLFMIVLSPFTLLIEWLAGALNILPELQLSVAHGIFNVVTTAFFFPLIPAIVKLIKKILPSSKKEINMDLSELDQNVVQLFPSHALAIAKNKIIEMGHITIEAVEGIRAYFETKNPLAKDGVYEMENAINTLDSKITEYLVLISHETLNDHDSNDYLANMKTIKDFERIGDLCINIVKYYEAIYDEKEDFSTEAREDLEAMMDMVIDMLNHAVKAFDTHDLDDIVYVDDKEADLDYFNKKAKQRHIKRVGRKIENSALVNSTYVDILANLERMGDHCQNISESYLLDESAYLNEEPESAFSK